MQRTIADTGLPALVPPRAHPDDIVGWVHGEPVARKDAILDCLDQFHADEEARDEADQQALTEFFESAETWAQDHVESGDYADMYSELLAESHYDWPDAIVDWLDDQQLDYWRRMEGRDQFKDFLELVAYHLDASNAGCAFQSNACDTYDGEGCALFSFDVNDYELELRFRDHPILSRLHEAGRLKTALDDSYDFFGSINSDSILVTTSPMGRWHFVMEPEWMHKAIAAAICQLCREAK